MSDTTDLYADYQEWKSWDDLFKYTPDHKGYFEKELADISIKNADVLEVGFGSGTCISWMIEQGARVAMTEISERSCQAAKKLGYDVLPADLSLAADANETRFDTIIAFDVFEHLDLETVGTYLDACSKMLRPGGKLLLRFPNAQSPFGLKHQAGDPTHKSELSLAVFNLLLARRPFKVLRYAGSAMYRGTPLKPVWFKRSLRRVLQKMINAVLNFVYASQIPYEPVVVIVLEKTASSKQLE